jgi:hypothetical protein
LVEDFFFGTRQDGSVSDAQMVPQHNKDIACTPTAKSTSRIDEASVHTNDYDAEKTVSSVGIRNLVCVQSSSQRGSSDRDVKVSGDAACRLTTCECG